MSMTELNYSRSRKIPRGSYNMDQPFFGAKVHLEGEVDYAAEYAKLRAEVDGQMERFEKEGEGIPDHIRIREKEGKKYPSVTSIINPDPLTGIPNLDKYSRRGKVLEELLIDRLKGNNHPPEYYMSDDETISPLKFEDIKYEQFLKEFGPRIKVIDNGYGDGPVIFNDEFMYSGEIDLLCHIDGELTLVDIKTGKYRATYDEQIYAYLYAYSHDPALVEKYGEIKKVAIFDLKDCKLRMVPSVKPFQRFLVKRGRFQERFSL